MDARIPALYQPSSDGMILIIDACGHPVGEVERIKCSPEGWPYYYENGLHVGYFVGGRPVKLQADNSHRTAGGHL